MTGTLLAALAGGALLGFFNGANDVSKGIATLVGSGVSDYRRAIRWGTLCTALGGVTAIVAGHAMVSTFGRGLLAPGVEPTVAAALATLFGAGAWVLIATRTGLPVSTTHAIVGALSGAAISAYGPAGLAWAALAKKVVLPLIASPLAALAATALLLSLVRVVVRKTPRAGSADCLCVEAERAPVVMLARRDGTAATALGCPVHVAVAVGTAEDCAREAPGAWKIALDRAHWLTSGTTSFARGLNDAPKLAALILATAALSGAGTPWLPAFAAATAGMILGSLLAGRRITRVLAEKVTRMDHEEGFYANLVTSVLVTGGALGGLPMSTTHVSTGAIIGGGVVDGRASVRWSTVATLALAWVVTLPASALLAAAIHAAVGLAL